MKRKILLILNMAIIGFSTAACSDDETNYITPEKKYPLTAFAVAINNVSANTTSYYHGKIDQTPTEWKSVRSRMPIPSPA